MPGSMRIYRKKRASAGSNSPTKGSPYWNLVGLSLQSKGLTTGNNNTVIDNSSYQRQITLFGNVAQGSFAPFEGGSSAYFDGAGDYLTVPSSSDITTITGDFTIEAWVYRITATGGLMDTRTSGGANSWVVEIQSVINFYTAGVARNGATTVPLNQWVHIAITRSGSTIRYFINGVQDANTFTMAGTITGGTGVTFIGSTRDYFTKGYVSNFNFINGTAKYTTNFLVPVEPAVAHANTKLMLNFNNGVCVDGSGKNNIETVGNVQLQKTMTKSGKGSYAFNGATDYLTVTPSPVLGTDDFTIEGWFYFTGVPTNMHLMGNRVTSGDTVWQAVIYPAGGVYHMLFSGGSSTYGDYSQSGNPVLLVNTWIHYAVTRSGSTFRQFLNGKLVTTVTASPNFSSTTPIRVGQQPNGSYPFFGYIEDFTISTGVAKYVADFEPLVELPKYEAASSVDPYYNNVVLHMHMNGSNGSTNFADQKGHVISTNTAGISTAQSKFGGSSGLFTTTGSERKVEFASSPDWSFGTGDFTIEGWFNATAWDSTQRWLASCWISPYPWGLDINQSQIRWSTTGGNVRIAANHALTLNTWYHIAVTRISGLTRLFVNGVQHGTSVTDTSNIGQSVLTIGAKSDGAGNAFKGYLDEWRITKGVGRYMANFAVPTAAFPDYQDFSKDQYLGNSLLIKNVGQGNNNTILDSSSINNVITRNGNVAQGTFSPFSSVGMTYSPEIHGGSAFFDGSGDYLTSVNSEYALGSGDFTIEMWVYPTNVSGTQCIMGCGPSAANSWQIFAGAVTARFNVSSGPIVDSAVVLGINQWHHIEVTRSGTTGRIFINGVQKGTATLGTNFTVNDIVIGRPYAALNQEHFIGYISGLHIIKGTAKHVANFTSPTAPNAPNANTKLLLNFTNAAIIDVTGRNNFETLGNIRTDAANKRFVNSINLNGTNSYLLTQKTSVFDFGTGDFTVECWGKFSSTTATGGSSPTLFGASNTVGNYIFQITENYMGIRMSQTEILAAAGASVAMNTWNHYVFCRQGTRLMAFRNGILYGSSTNSTSITLASPIVYIFSNNNVGGFINGAIEDLRITKGAARYVSNFVVPLKEHPVA